jgi:hypothetical protein
MKTEIRNQKSEGKTHSSARQRRPRFSPGLVLCFLLSSFCFLPSAFAGTHVTATYDLGANPLVMTTVSGTAEYGLIFIQRNEAVSYGGVEYGRPVLEGYLDAGGSLNDGAGNLYLDLVPNSTATPAGSYYVVTVNIQGKVHAEIWVVPDAASVDAALCRQAQPPSPAQPALYYQTLEQAGAALPQRLKLNLLGSAVSCADDAGQLSTDCTFAAGTGGGASPLASSTTSGTVKTDADTADPVVYLKSSADALLAAKVPSSRQILTTAPLQGGGSLAGDLTFSCPSCEVTGNKNAPSGYAGLSAAGKLAASQGQEVWSVTDLADYASVSGTGSTALRASISAPAASDVLTWNGSNWINQAPSGGAAHNLLSATHADTAPAAVQRGALVTGQGATPAWTLLPLDAAGKYLKSDGTDLVYSSGAASGVGACATHGFATTLNADAAPGCAQPAFSDLAGSAAPSQLPATTVFTGQANTWTAGAQDFGAATALKVPVSAGAAPAASGLIAYDSTANLFKGGTSSASKTFAFTDSNISGTAANVTGIVAPSNGGTGASNTAALGRYLRGDGTNFVASSVAAAGAGACANQFVRAANDNAPPTCSSVGAADVAIASPSGAQLSGVSSANLAAANKTLEKSIVIFAPATTDTNMVQIYFGQAVTLARLACSTDTGSVDINFDQRTEAAPNSAGTNVLSSSLSCTTSTGVTTAFTSASVSADAPLNLQIAAVSGTPNVVRIHVKVTMD